MVILAIPVEQRTINCYMTSLVRACFTFYVDICRFRAMNLSPLHLVVNWPVFTSYNIYIF